MRMLRGDEKRDHDGNGIELAGGGRGADSSEADLEIQRSLKGAETDEQVPLTPEEFEEIEVAGDISPPNANFINQLMLIFAFAILGVYLRIELSGATPSGLVNYLTSQFVGSFVIGFIYHLKEFIHPDLYMAIGVGFCGSITTFSSWQVDIVETLVGVPGAQPMAGGKAYVWFQDEVIGFAVPFVALLFGKNLARVNQKWLYDNYFKFMPRTDRKGNLDFFIRWFSICSFVLGLVGIILGATLVPGLTTFSLIFAPFGALTRFALSTLLNPITTKFYWGTFASNLLGCVISGVLFGITTLYDFNAPSCDAIWAVEHGYSGALSTVSTFVNEVHVLPKVRYSFVYGFASVMVSQAILIIIMGSFVWTQIDPFAQPFECFLNAR